MVLVVGMKNDEDCFVVIIETKLIFARKTCFSRLKKRILIEFVNRKYLLIIPDRMSSKTAVHFTKQIVITCGVKANTRSFRE